MLTFLATIGVAIIGLIGVILQTKSQERQTHMIEKLEAFRKESKEEDEKLKAMFTKSNLSSVKCWLVCELSKIKTRHVIPTAEMKAALKEAHDRYNSLGGDSYIDDLFDELKNNGLL